MAESDRRHQMSTSGHVSLKRGACLHTPHIQKKMMALTLKWRVDRVYKKVHQ